MKPDDIPSITRAVLRPYAIVKQMQIVSRFEDEGDAVRALRARLKAGQSVEIVVLTNANQVGL